MIWNVILFAAGIIATLWSVRMGTSAYQQNLLLAIAWVFFVTATYRLPLIQRQPSIPRVLWTTLVGSVIGLVLYYALVAPRQVKELPDS